MNKKNIALAFLVFASFLVVMPVLAKGPNDSKPKQNMASSTASSMVRENSRENRISAIAVSKARIVVASNRIMKIADSLAIISVKLQARIAELQPSVKVSTTTLQAVLTDMNAKIADAKVQAAMATSSLASLSTNVEDNEAFKANKKILVDAQEKIKAGNKDLLVARKDAETIIKALKISKPKQSTASTTPATTTPTGNGGTLSQ